MEILIVGIVVVALMVFVSTKIKRSAAEAFEPEAVETEDFTIYKPAGFIHPLNEDSELAFEANSKDWGQNDASKLRQARAALRVVADANFKTVCETAKKSAGKITTKKFVENAAGQKIFTLEGETSEADVKIATFWKIVESGQKIYELKAAIIETYAGEFAGRIREMLESFTVK